MAIGQTSGGLGRRVARVLHGYDELSSVERVQFDSELSKYKASITSEKVLLSETYRKGAELVAGPVGTNNGCPCCGR